MTLGEFYQQVRQGFNSLDVRLLICHALHMTQEEFLLEKERSISEAEIRLIHVLLEQRKTGKPVAKIKGYKEFYGRKFVTSEATLDPRPDTEILIDAAKRVIPIDQPCRVLDLGTGTGCIGLTLMMERPHASLVAVDFSKAALAVAHENTERFTLMDRVQLVESNWCQAVTGRYDVIVSNPPYIPSGIIPTLDTDVKDYDPYLALDGGIDGLDPYRNIISDLPRVLALEGWVFFEVGHHQASAVSTLLQQGGMGSIKMFKDLAGIDRVVAGRRV